MRAAKSENSGAELVDHHVHLYPAELNRDLAGWAVFSAEARVRLREAAEAARRRGSRENEGFY